MLLKIVLLAYSRSIIGSRRIEAAYREPITFIALSGDSQPHFTTLAAFVSDLGDRAATLFAQVLATCDRQGLIGREMFAIDGVKLPSNASKAKSGTRADFLHRAEKMEAAVKKRLDGHRQADAGTADGGASDREARPLARLQADARPTRAWLAAVDECAQVTVDAQAQGTGSEPEWRRPVVAATASLRSSETLITADAGYHREANRKTLLAEAALPALITDTGMRQRDERFEDPGRRKAKPDPLHDKTKTPKAAKRYRAGGFRRRPPSRYRPLPGGQGPLPERVERYPQRLPVRPVHRCPAGCGTDACAPRRRPRSGRSASSGARPPMPRKPTPTG